MKKVIILLLCLCGTGAFIAQTQWLFDTVITVGTNVSGIDITPDGSKIAVSCKTNPGSVKIISTGNYSITSIDVSGHENNPDAVCITGNNGFALAATLHKIVYINMSTNAVVGSFTAPCAGTTLYGMDVTSDGQTVYFPDLSNGCTQQVMRSTPATAPGAISTPVTVSTGGILTAIAINASNSTAMITAYNGNPRIVTLSSGAVTNVTGLSGSYGIAALHNSNEALVFDGDSIVRINMNGTIVKKIAALSFNTAFQNIAITNDDKYAFVMGAFEKLVINLTDNTVLQTFTAGGTNVACQPDGSKFYVTDYFNGTVRVYKKSGGSGLTNDPVAEGQLIVYPNPAVHALTIDHSGVSGTGLELLIFDLKGRLVKTLELNGRKTELPLSQMAKGLYHYELSHNGGTLHGRFVVE